ncbi:uncharacterized protein L969DRAFT_93243 [Mixia osmundae IAM 14324]|uniref:Synaptobrevin homolog YKT6 n=1 Tax=Mixia osmundae (strain CBS 9802 / IAM 14324 / JCM 22182 / KY 12970) TaxID=764103 RepID=G7E5N6_MIXOS|nr:uncharacterized protein L969DRAFT_93243 [Mixia osmundae IAM 14324]KEI40705.1 hypothetical protein L969DRAFT_93243 [Mixia osmundae IAM 14324]GAA98146.1 hypothetical protein E5Q_04829 [Mixia osmundae IAM 14324]
MKITSIQVLSRAPGSSNSSPLAEAHDVASFSFYQRGAVTEFLSFLAKTVSDRTQPGQRQSIQEQNYIAHVYARDVGSGPTKHTLVGVVVSDAEYPVRVAFSLLNKILDEFPQDKRTGPVAFPQLATYLQKYQDPKQADTIMKVQQELDETKIVLHKTIESVLERGEKLDSLVDRSNALSASSKMFYKSAKKQNSCCVIC